jgi:metal-sulfur cluster biosynthetic enzyme
VTNAPLDPAAVREALSDVPDPELPVVSVVDLGMVHRVAVEDDRIRVELLPTFDDHGEHVLKGVPGSWHLYAVRS